VDKKYSAGRKARYSLIVILIICLIQAKALGQEVEENEIDLEKIVVTSRGAGLGLGQVSENVEIIGQKEIKQLPVRDLGQALDYIPGVYVDPGPGFDHPSSISIQGSDSRQVRVMIDGIPLNTQASGQVNPSKFPIENAARIETIKGAASSIWGSSLGGVINIITKDTGTTLIPKGNISGSYAGYRTQKQNGELSGKVAGLGYYLFASHMESGGKGARDDVSEKKAFGKLSYDLKELGKIAGSFGFSQGDVNSGELPDGTWEATPYRCQYGKLGWSNNFEGVDLNIDLKNSRQDIVTKDFDNISTDVPWQIIRSKDVLYQVSIVSAAHPRGKDLLIVGMDSDWDILKSTYLTKAKSLNLQAPFTNYTLKLDPWHLNFGLRYDRNSEFSEDLSPSFGCVYHFNGLPATFVRANVSHAFNAPPLLWKYYDESLSGLAVNPDLKPERAWVYELGIESQPLSKLWLKLSLYRADVSDAISSTTNDQGQWIKKNFEKFRRQGIEAQLKLQLLRGLSFFSTAAFNDVENRLTREIVKDTDSPRQSFDLGFEYKHKIGLSLYLDGRYNYWNRTYDIFQPNDKKFVFDFKASQKIKNFTCFMNVYNLFNSGYWADYYFPTPRRYFEGGVTIEW